MKKVMVATAFMLVVAWAVAQQPGTAPSGGQAPSQQQPSGPPAPSQQPGQAPSPNAPQTGAEPGAQSQASNLPVTEGCLAGSHPNFTLTDKAGTTYKLNFSQEADTSVLTSHVGESVQVLGQVSDAAGAGKASSIDVRKIGKGAGKCPASKPPSP
jgi:uncharacterized protein YdeI (BOF family)